MASQFVDIAVPSISSASTGKRALKDVVSIDVTMTHTSTPVKTMNRLRRSRGFQNNTPEYSADLETAVALSTAEVDWVAFQQTKEYFTLTWSEGIGGIRRQLVDCQVGDVSDTYSEEGEMRRRVSVMALDFRQVPT